MKFSKLMSLVLCGVALAAALSGCTVSKQSSSQERRQAVLTMEKDTLADLYKVQPLAKAEIAAAPGYAVFSNANVNLIFASFGGGYGVVTDKSGKHTYMKMGEVGVGLGLGLKDFRAVFVFHDQKTMDRFIRSGWEFGGHADAAAKASDMGAAVAGEALLDGISVYQLTESGLALEATVKGTKYWQDGDLN
ncbi:MAG TPA: YSC84-related protein [Candidatus Acidoferrum sp.]|nr:YSC84-related protein [Candidatus Acidoferrum sp.]